MSPPQPAQAAGRASRQTGVRQAGQPAARIGAEGAPPEVAASRAHPAPAITGSTGLIAHLGVPTHTFRAPSIYNPYFAAAGIDAVVVPMGCEPADFPAFLKGLFGLRNIVGALITMPHKMVAARLVDSLSTAAAVCGACNAVRRDGKGRLIGDMFDGEGFVRGLTAKGRDPAGQRAAVIGAGGVGSAIAAALAAAGAAHVSLSDARPGAAERLAARLATHYPALQVSTGAASPAEHAIVVNATPLGSAPDDPLPFDLAAVDAKALVGEVVLAAGGTLLIHKARARGLAVQEASDMLFEQIPAYLEFFGLPSTSPDRLRALAWLD